MMSYANTTVFDTGALNTSLDVEQSANTIVANTIEVSCNSVTAKIAIGAIKVPVEF